MKYFLDNSKENIGFREQLDNVLNSEGMGDVALVLSERIINMPAAVAAPSYKMLLEEIQWANEDVSFNFRGYSEMNRKSLMNSATTYSFQEHTFPRTLEAEARMTLSQLSSQGQKSRSDR